MATKNEIAVLRIELLGIEPLIWRRFAVSEGMSLIGIHRVIQAAMGWLDCHLWDFEVNGRKYGLHLPDDPDWNDRLENAENFTLGTFLHAGQRQFQYVYDMGDFWEHSIILERVTAPLAKVNYPQFLGGERRCPPEDCGGVPGYYEFLKNITSKQRKTRESAFKWYGGPYDPDDINERKVTVALSRIGSVGTER